MNSVKIIEANQRIKTYLNYGLVSYLVVILFLRESASNLMILFPLIFNYLLLKKLTEMANNEKLWIYFIAIISSILVFWLQFNFINRNVSNCIRFTFSSSINSVYASSTILYSIIVWEIGLHFSKNINHTKELPH